MPERPKPRRLQFKADNEKEEYDAEFRKMKKLFTVRNETCNGADRNARGQITEDRAKPKSLEKRGGDDGPSQNHQAL